MKCLKLEDLSFEQKIGMVLTARCMNFSKKDTEFICGLIKNHALGGVQINPTKENLDVYMKMVREIADYPILIGCDMERGYPLGNSLIPGNMALGALNSEKAVYDFAYITAKCAKKVGYNMIWSPVVDAADHDRPCTVCRCFGSDRERISDYAAEYLKAFSECGIIGSVKHFPSAATGYMDTHMAEAVSAATKEEIYSVYTRQYQKLIETMGDDMMGVMAAHTKVPSIDEKYPTTLSKKVLGTLRGYGYNGLIISDSFAMVGLISKFGNDKILGMAIDAGIDLILPNFRISFEDSYNYLLKNFKDGMFSEERLDEAVSHVLKAQERTLKTPDCLDVTESEEEYLRSISQNCICEFKDENVPSALDKEKKHLFVVLQENKYPMDSREGGANEISFVNWWEPEKIKEKLLAIYKNSKCDIICEFPSQPQVETVCVDATECDDVVYITFCDCAPYLGTDGLTDRMRILIEATKDKNAALVHLGNPYAMDKVIHVPRLIIGFQHKDCTDAALDVLSGKLSANGKLPVKLKDR